MRTRKQAVMVAWLAATTAMGMGAVAASAADDSSIARGNSQSRTIIDKFYPRASLKRGEEGAVRFRIAVNGVGKIDACQVIASSGYRALDKATCALLLDETIDGPATIANGWRDRLSAEGAIVWTLPVGVAKSATVPAFTATPNAVGEALTCRVAIGKAPVGQGLRTRLTASQWTFRDENDSEGQGNVLRYRNQLGK